MAEALQLPPKAIASKMRAFARVIAALMLLYVFMVGVNALGSGFKSLGGDFIDSFFAATANPFVGLMVGLLATTLAQSSSVSTALIVGLVAAPDNPLPVANAVPMIMGANIGTTVTNTLVSLAHVGRLDEFRRAFAVATCHDFFNYMSVAILLPLELTTGFLRRSATALSSLVGGLSGARYHSPIKGAIKAGAKLAQEATHLLTGSSQLQAILLIVLSGILIFTSLILLVSLLKSLMRHRVEGIVSRVLGERALLGMVVGVVVTVMVQSSSITTSLLVPLAGAGLMSLKQAFPITIGANIGTTVTAFLAALAATGPNAQAALTIALVHLLFNLCGTLIIYPLPKIRQIPLRAAIWLAGRAVVSRKWALLYVLGLFYVLPALFALLNGTLG